MVRQAVGPGIELVVAQDLAHETQRRGRGITQYLGFEQLLDKRGVRFSDQFKPLIPLEDQRLATNLRGDDSARVDPIGCDCPVCGDLWQSFTPAGIVALGAGG